MDKYKIIRQLSPQSVTGTYYYYAVVTVSFEEYGSVAATTEPIAITFNEVDNLITELKDSGSASDPFMLYSQEDLEYVKSLVESKNGEPFDCAGQTFAFANDIYLSADWEPIGKIKGDGKESNRGISILPFAGILDGNGYTLIIADQGKCLFNYVRTATVKNLNIKGSHIRGYALVQKYIVDYGADGKYEGSTSEKTHTIDIENVTVKSDTKILQGGFIGGYASGANTITISNCIIEKGVTIGNDGSWGKIDESEYQYEYVGTFSILDQIGSFAGSFNGVITNSVSYATVYGRNAVGGLVASKGQSMGSCDFINCAFLGKIIATGSDVGGIIGRGYPAATGTPMVQIHNCYVVAEISGKDNVGGIIGAEAGHSGNTDEGDIYGVRGTVSISNNHFYGKLSAEGENVGGIVGYFRDFTQKTGEATNFFVNTCRTDKAIGGVAEGNEVVGEELFGLALSEGEFSNGTVTAKLNSNLDEFAMLDYAEWLQAAKYPVLLGSAESVEAIIDAIGEIELTHTWQSKINAARKVYDELNDALKQYVSNYQKLLDAESEYYDLLHADDEPIHIVIGAANNAAAKGEANPNTGAPAA